MAGKKAKSAPPAAPVHPRATNITTTAGKTYLMERDDLPSPVADSAAISDWKRTRTTFGESVITPNPDELIGKKGIRMYQRMSVEDETVRACLALLRASIIGSGWKLTPGADTPAGRETADLLTEDLRALPGAFEQSLADILTALWAGYSLTFATWHLDGRIRIRRLQSLQPDGLDFEMDAFGNITNITQQSVGGPQKIDPKRCIHFTIDALFSNPYGQSLLRAAYRPWFFKLNFSQWQAAWGEKLAHAPVVIKTPRMAQRSQVDETLRVVDRMQARTALSVPEDWAVELLESSQNPRATFGQVLDRYDMQIARSILVPDKLGYSGGQVEGGSFNLAETQRSAMNLLLEQLRRSLEATLTDQLLTPATLYAFGNSTPVPRFTLLPLDRESKLSAVQAYNTLIQSGALDVVPEDAAHVRQLLDFPAVEASSSREEPPRARGIVALTDTTTAHGARKMASGASRRGPGRSGDGGHPLAPSSPATFSEPKDQALWRELTMAEKRADIVRWDAERKKEERAFGEVVAEGAAELVADVKAQVERMGDAYRRNPDAVNKLAPSEATLNKIRSRIETGLSRAYQKGADQALTSVEAATAAERDVPQLIKEFCEVDRDDLSVTMRGRWDSLYSALRERGYVK